MCDRFYQLRDYATTSNPLPFPLNWLIGFYHDLLASRYGSADSIRRDRPLTIRWFRTLPSVFSEESTIPQWTLYPHTDHYLVR